MELYYKLEEEEFIPDLNFGLFYLLKQWEELKDEGDDERYKNAIRRVEGREYWLERVSNNRSFWKFGIISLWIIYNF